MSLNLETVHNQPRIEGAVSQSAGKALVKTVSAHPKVENRKHI
jgi:hypothetical protein